MAPIPGIRRSDAASFGHLLPADPVMQEFIDDSAGATTVSDLAALYRCAIARLDCEHFALVQLGDVARSGPTTDTPPIVAIEYPDPWVRRYFSQDYFSVDPVVRQARATAMPFTWSSIAALSAHEREVLGESVEAGMKHGLSIPIHAPHGRVFLSSVATSQSSFNVRLLQPLLHMLAVQFHVRFCELGGALGRDGSVRLTARERECLLWTARGKSSWDISRLIGISEHTVNFHVKNAMSKLGTTSRVSAVAKCVSMGLIAP